jgi:hypothetical protein
MWRGEKKPHHGPLGAPFYAIERSGGPCPIHTRSTRALLVLMLCSKVENIEVQLSHLFSVLVSARHVLLQGLGSSIHVDELISKSPVGS